MYAYVINLRTDPFQCVVTIIDTRRPWKLWCKSVIDIYYDDTVLSTDNPTLNLIGVEVSQAKRASYAIRKLLSCELYGL